MPTEAQAINLHQCLFGYDDGHRLLASSIRLPDEAASPLLLLSDLAPGLSTSDVDSYWTGVSLTAARYYALMQTWPAPEVPRPGCVWTHALLIGFADIARFGDLSQLAKWTARPTATSGFEAYTEPLSLEPTSLRPGRDEDMLPVRVEDALRVIRAIYGTTSNAKLYAKSGALDEAIFEAWSQQWPRLRRSFSFRTATSSSDLGASGVRFDLRILLGSEHHPAGLRSDAASTPEPWELVAVDDLRRSQPTEFRRFLWRYGSDIRRGRERFRFLAKLYLSTRIESLADGQLHDTLMQVSDALPILDEGRVLKDDLVSCGRSQYSLLPPSDPLDTFQFFVRHSEVRGLPAPPAEAFEALLDLWQDRSDEILSIAEQAAQSTSTLRETILKRLAGLVDPNRFLESTVNRPNLRGRLLHANPLLLDSDYLVLIPQPELSQLLALVSADESIAGRLISRLLVLDDQAVADEMLARFPEVTMRLAADRIERSMDRGEGGVSAAWLRAIAARPTEFWQGGFVEAARSTRVLALFAEMLGHDSPVVLPAGPLPWALALGKAKDDVQGHPRQVFLAFLLAVALVRPVPGCEPLFERAFEPIHADLWSSVLPYDASAILIRHLPDLYWWEQWDKCLRLRIAVVNAYVKGDLNPQSFRRLTPDRWLFERLVNLAGDTKGGRRFLKRVPA